MGLLYKRPLAAGCLLLILSVVVVSAVPLAVSAWLLAAVGGCFLICLIAFWRRRTSYRRFWLLLLALAALVGSCRVFFQRQYETSAVESLLHTEVTAVATVEDVYHRMTYGSSLLVVLEELNGEPCELNAAITAEAMLPLGLGDRIGGRFYLRSVYDAEVEERTRSTYLADGVTVVLEWEESAELDLIESGNGSFASTLDDLRYALHHNLKNEIGGEAGDLLGALLIGTRDDLDAETVRDFRRAGLSHVLALSGLHLAILVAIIERVLRVLRVGKRGSSVLLIVFCVFYLALTGFSYSMLRAVIMLMLLRGAFFLGSDHDALTALTVGGALIVLVTPEAVFSLSFQMTMLATFGILAFGSLYSDLTGRFHAKRRVKRMLIRVGIFFVSSIAVTLSAMLAILPIQWLVFGEVSLITPIANLPITFLLIPLLLLGLVILLLTLMGIPVAFLAVPAKYTARAVLGITESFSASGSVLSLRYDFVPYVLIPLFAATIILLLVQLKKQLRALVALPLALAVVAFGIALPVTNALGADRVEMVYHTTGTDDALLLVQNGRAVICDVSSGSLARFKAHDTLLQDMGVCEIEVLLLTHYHKAQGASLASFCRSNLVRKLWLPEPESEQDEEVLAYLLLLAMEEDIAVTVYRRGEEMTVFGEGSLTVSAVLTHSRSVEPALFIELSYGAQTVRYETASYAEYAVAQGIVSQSNCTRLIIGGHGPRPHGIVTAPSWQNLCEVWISDERAVEYFDPSDRLRYIVCPEVRSVTLHTP